MPRSRLDVALVTRGLAMSRERAQALILANQVTVNGKPSTKAGTPVDDDDEVQLKAPDHPWVSRGGLKLARALEVFHVDVTGLTALDIGASTGGFTDVLLHHGATRVVALDVGHNQIDWKLRTDPRVTVIEGANARYLNDPGLSPLPADAQIFGIITIDVSFISLAHILPVVPAHLAPGGRVIALVKPQFEAGRDDVGKGGIVRDPEVHARVIDAVTRTAAEVGLQRVGLAPSPIEGAEGNREFLMCLALA